MPKSFERDYGTYGVVCGVEYDQIDQMCKDY